MPVDKAKYPKDWSAIARVVKDRAEWTCQECGKPCRKPGVSWDSFAEWLLTDEKENWHEQVTKPQRFTLTVAQHHARNASATRAKKKTEQTGQLSLI